jgi:DNA-binding MarR family transcriptional regulator
MDLEARLHSQHPEALRLWLRMLTCSQLIEKRIRQRLRSEFDTTLPRFDLMAQLERSPEGLQMNALSKRLMVTGGNVTGIADQLEHEGIVERIAVAGDRRATFIALTAKGRREFHRMAQRHEAWIVEAFSALDASAITQLQTLLSEVKAHQMKVNAA